MDIRKSAQNTGAPHRYWVKRGSRQRGRENNGPIEKIENCGDTTLPTTRRKGDRRSKFPKRPLTVAVTANTIWKVTKVRKTEKRKKQKTRKRPEKKG